MSKRRKKKDRRGKASAKAKPAQKSRSPGTRPDRRPAAPAWATESLLVENFETGEVTGIGGPGMVVYSTAMTLGDVTPVLERPDDFELVIQVDLPFYLPIPDQPFRVAIPNRTVQVLHISKRRGQERYSTIDSRLLPYFSSLQISVRPAFVDMAMPGNDVDPFERGSLDIIKDVVAKIEGFLQPLGVTLHDRMPALSYDVLYVERATAKVVAKTEHPYNEIIEVLSPAKRAGVDTDTLRAFLAASIDVAALGEATRERADSSGSFRQKVFIIIHDFLYYCRQHAESVKELPEEMIRDLLLVLFKTVFGSAEGEPYHFDGKLDFKVTNPEVRHEFVTGELKWWDGPATFDELIDQALRKHVTGQEAEVFCVVLSDRTDQGAVAASAIERLGQAGEVEGEIRPRQLPEGSKERWYEATATVRGSAVPVNVAIADLFHERV